MKRKVGNIKVAGRLLVCSLVTFILVISSAAAGVSAATTTATATATEAVTLAKSVISSVKTTEDGNPKITWKKVANADGYRLYRKAEGETKYTAVGTTKKLTLTDKKWTADEGTKIAYTVRAYKKVDGVVQWGKCATAKKWTVPVTEKAPGTHVNKINISINPDANIITDDAGIVTGVEYVNEDAKTAYGDLELKGLTVSEATELMVEAAVEKEFLQNGKPITLTLIDTELDGQKTLDSLSKVKEATQKELTEQKFEHSTIHAAIHLEAEYEHEHEHDNTCDLCLGSGLLVCDACNGTTFFNGNAWTVCGKCSGEGRTLCTLCAGEGLVECGNCGGSGKDASESDGICFGCKGTGRIKCNRCQDGSGYQVCYDCKGAGILPGLPCNRCGGTLWAVCYRCRGTGVMNN